MLSDLGLFLQLRNSGTLLWFKIHRVSVGDRIALDHACKKINTEIQHLCVLSLSARGDY